MVNKLDKLNRIVKGAIHFLYYKHRKGHGVHSPAAYEFVSKVLFDKKKYTDYSLVEKQVKLLQNNPVSLEIVEYGAGSAVFSSTKRKICEIARYAGTEQKMGRLLYRIAQYYKPKIVIELGTSLGIGSMYLAKGLGTNGRVFTVEGIKTLVDVARQNSQALGLTNIDFTISNFDESIDKLEEFIKGFVVVFIDGNHTYEATLRYFRLFNAKIQNGLIIIDDIYWSRAMEKAWNEIKDLSEVSFDLFSAGIVMKGEMLTPHRYKIRF